MNNTSNNSKKFKFTHLTMKTVLKLGIIINLPFERERERERERELKCGRNAQSGLCMLIATEGMLNLTLCLSTRLHDGFSGDLLKTSEHTITVYIVDDDPIFHERLGRTIHMVSNL